MARRGRAKAREARGVGGEAAMARAETQGTGRKGWWPPALAYYMAAVVKVVVERRWKLESMERRRRGGRERAGGDGEEAPARAEA